MLGGVAEFAVTGDFGTDVFRRVDDANQRRYRYECIATALADSDVVTAHHDFARKHPDRVQAAIERFRSAAFLQKPVCLGTPASYPTATDVARPLELFVYLDFFRMWQIADQEISRMSELARSGGTFTGPEISSALRLLLDFNQIRRAQTLIASVLPHLRQTAQTCKDDKWQNAGFSLRMIGDLELRAGRPADALAAYELAIALGDNPHRRGLAVHAAHAAHKPCETLAHLKAYEDRWPLPQPLAEIQRIVAQHDTGA